jgi:hypothetical protein
MYQHTVYQLLTNSVYPLVLTPPRIPLSTHPLLTLPPIWGGILGVFTPGLLSLRARARVGDIAR